MTTQIIHLTINPHYRALVPRPPADQYAALKESIKNDGQHMPVIVNQAGVVLDGHTRYDICKELGIEPEYEVRHFDDLEEEEKFVVVVNLSRRHLNVFQKCEILYKWYEQEKSTRRQRAGNHTWMKRRGKYYGKTERLYNRIGKMIGCSHHKVFFSMYLIKNADEAMKRRLRNDTMSTQTAYQIVSKKKLMRPQDYDRDFKRYPTCPNCGSPTKTPWETGCHVHALMCCLKCKWGN